MSAAYVFLGCALVLVPQWLLMRRRHAEWHRAMQSDPFYREYIARERRWKR